MIENNGASIFTILLTLILLLWLVIELRKAVLVLIKNQLHIFFFAQVGLFLLRLYPGDKKKKHKEIMDNYKKNIKTYSVFTVIGSVYFIYIAFVVLFR